jgi:hypothetical protein
MMIRLFAWLTFTEAALFAVDRQVFLYGSVAVWMGVVKGLLDSGFGRFWWDIFRDFTRGFRSLTPVYAVRCN